MATGDVIIGIFPDTRTWVTFQPAVGVEIMITGLIGYALSYVGHSNGTSYSYSNSSVGGAFTNIKVAITNTNYLNAQSDSWHCSYSGIQIS
tara:strand:+ start:548 stop:820 length:273 start_codon:yes stop_codon:yes gene_type:complete